MAVYVDSFNARYGRMIMCHMVADDLGELHAMAEKIGVKRKWFQGFARASFPHYDICLAKKKLAIKSGAIEVDKYGLRDVMQRNREKFANEWIENGWPVNE